MFRPPQVPQQPQVFFPRGQPLGIPVPRTDYQAQQSAAYWRERPQLEALEQASGVVDYPATAGAKTFVPAQSVPLVFPAPRPSLEALEQALLITDAPLTTGQPLGIPNPRTEYQMAAYFPPHPIAIEVLSEQLELAYTPGFAVGIPNPQQGDQTAAYRRERPSLEALEQAAQVTDQPATVGQPLGIPNPRQSDQTASLWRLRAEILQPQVFAPISAAPAFVPYAPMLIPAPVSWRFEWLIDLLQPQFTPGQPLGTPVPRQSEQTASYWRARAEIQAQPLFVPQGAPPAFVPANRLPTPIAASPRFVEAFAVLQLAVPHGVGPQFVPAVRVCTPSNSYVPALQPPVGVAAILAPTPVAQPFIRGELIPLAPFNGRIAVTFDDRRIVFGADAGRRITVSADDRRVGVSANDRLILPTTPRKPH